ncbi:MAG: xylose isomerase [Porticoccaceae bacterium]|nr:xylose isomerase [Porticoccaceae bacterium]
MQLLTFKTLWGYPDQDLETALDQACAAAVAEGYQGVEGPVPADACLRDSFAGGLERRGLAYIAEICTAGSYVPDRTAPLEEHLADLKRQLARLAPLKPVKVNCLGGCDRWSIDTSLAFFDAALEMADRFGVTIGFETHRGRSLYSPWTAEVLLGRRDLPVTCDFSHWCVVCEGMGDSESDLIRQVASRAVHIHGRIGFDQGPQVSDPQSFLYREDLEKHLRWWSWIWQAQDGKGESVTTLTPEFGPDGYQALNPRTGQPFGDLDRINAWMADTVKTAFGNRQETRHV